MKRPVQHEEESVEASRERHLELECCQLFPAPSSVLLQLLEQSQGNGHFIAREPFSGDVVSYMSICMRRFWDTDMIWVLMICVISTCGRLAAS
jgi:hypothetical protein